MAAVTAGGQSLTNAVDSQNMTTKRQLTIAADVKPFRLEWTIENYRLSELPRKTILKSNLHSISGLPSTTKWQLLLYTIYDDRYDGHVSIYLNCLCHEYGVQYPITFSFTIKSANNENDYTVAFKTITIFSKKMTKSLLGAPKFIRIRTLEARASDLLPNDTLTLICKGEVMMGMERNMTPEVRGYGLLEDMKCMVESQVGRDVTLVASDGSEHPVHKFILCARSPVFAAMFRHDTEEKETGRVVIKDMQPDVLRGLISFMCTDEAPADVTELAMDLLIASNKYEIPRLQFMMEKHISNTLTVENAINVLSHTIYFYLPTLKDACLLFIRSNAKSVRESQTWKKCTDVDVFRVLTEFLDK